MTKSDDYVKNMLKDRLETGKYKVRTFIGTGSEKADQELWQDGGLTFRLNEMTFGSNDFAIYRENKWPVPETLVIANEEPLIIIEGTDGLNRGSSGDAQVQRIHHLYPSALMGIISIYYLIPGKHNIYGQMMGAMYWFSKYYQKKTGKNTSVLLVTSDLSDIQNLIDVLDKPQQLSIEIEKILNSMKRYFDNYFRTKYKGSWELFFRKTTYGRCKNGDVFAISAIRPPHPSTGKPPWSDSHHRAASIPLLGRYLLMGSGKYDPEINNYFFILPLFRKKELHNLGLAKGRDKEWQIFIGKKFGWSVITFDDLVGLDENDLAIMEEISATPNLNKNPQRTLWKKFRDKIYNGLEHGRITINLDADTFGNLQKKLGDFFGND